MIKFLSKQKSDKISKRPFEDVYSEYYTLMSKYIYKRIQNKEISDSLVSDVFFRALRNYESFDPEKASEKTWLFCIAGNILKNYYRDRKISEPLENCENSLSASYENDMDEAVYYQECRECLAEALKMLSENQRKVIVLKYFKDMTSEEIAENLGMTSGNVRITSMRALKKLSEILKKKGFVQEDFK